MVRGLTGRFGQARHARVALQILACLVPATLAAVEASRPGTIVGIDTLSFVQAGHTLLSSHWSRAFSASSIQVGPLQLALYGSVGRSLEALAVVLATATALLVVATTRAVGVKNPALLGAAGLLAVGGGLTSAAYSAGHPADTLIPLFWILAAADARRGHTLRAGLVIGLCAGLETWAILGVAVLALSARGRDARRGTLVAAAVASALFLPFVVGGHFAMLAYQWHVRPPSPMSLLVPDGTTFGWPLRLAQGVIAVTAGVAVVWLLRHSPHALWAAPLAIVVARLQFDPLLFMYYLAAPQGPILVGAMLGASRLRLLRTLSWGGITKKAPAWQGLR